MGRDDCSAVLFSIDATPVGDERYPIGTAAKVFSTGDRLVAKVDGNVVASFSKSYEDAIRGEKDKKIVLGARVGDTMKINIMVPVKRSREVSGDYWRLYESGLALGYYDDDTLQELMDSELLRMYKTMPGAWTGLAMTLTGDQSSNEIINTLKVMIRQNSVLMKQNEMIIRELRRWISKED